MNKKISELETIAGADINTESDNFPFVDASAGQTKKTTLLTMWNALKASFNGLVYMAFNADADYVPIIKADGTTCKITMKGLVQRSAAYIQSLTPLPKEYVAINGACVEGEVTFTELKNTLAASIGVSFGRDDVGVYHITFDGDGVNYSAMSATLSYRWGGRELLSAIDMGSSNAWTFTVIDLAGAPTDAFTNGVLRIIDYGA